MSNDVDITIRAKDLSREAFAGVSKSMQQVKKDSEAVGTAGASSFGKMSGSLRQFDDVLQLAGGPNLRDLIQGVGQLGDVADAGAGKLGGLAKAGLIASAAMAGVQVGRWIADFTGSDTIIGNATAKLMGWGDVAGQQAAAGADVLARASKNAGRQITDMTEAVRINEAATTKAMDVMVRSQAPAQSAAMIAKWRGELDGLRSSGVLDNLRKDLESNNLSQKDLADRYRISSDAMQIFAKQTGETRKSLDKATTSADQHREKIKQLGESYRGMDAITSVKDAIESLHKEEMKGFSISDMTRGRAEALNKVVMDAIDVNRRAGKAVPEEWQRIARETTFASQQGIADITDLIQAMQGLEQIAVRMPAHLIPSIGVTSGIPGGVLPGVNVGKPTAPKGPNMFTQMFGTSADFGALMSKTMLGAIQGGGSPFAAAGSLVGGKLGEHIGVGLAQKAGSSVLGKALGGVLSAGLPIVGSLIGPAVTALIGKLFGTAGRDAVKDFAATFGGFDALQKEMLALGPEYDRLWRGLTQGVGRNNPAEAKAAIDAVTKALEAQKAKTAETAAAAIESSSKQQEALDGITAKYAETLSKLESEYKSLSDSVAQEAEEDVMGIVEAQQRARMAQIENEQAALKQQRDEEIASKRETFDAILTDAERVNVELREMFGQPMEIPYYFRAGNTPGLGGMDLPGHAAGAYIRQDHIARVHAGEMIGPPEFFARAMGAGGGGTIVIENRMIVDGRVAARSTVRHQRDEVGRFLRT